MNVSIIHPFFRLHLNTENLKRLAKSIEYRWSQLKLDKTTLLCSMTFRLTCIFMKKLNCIWQFCQKSQCYFQKLFVFSWLLQILQKMSGVYWYPLGKKAHWLNFQHHYQCPYDSSFQQNHPGIVLINLIYHSPLWKLLLSTVGYPEKKHWTL